MTDWVKPTREQVIEWRRDGLTWTQIAEQCGVTRNPLCRWVATLDLPDEANVRQHITARVAANAEIRRLVVVKQYSDRALATHLGIEVHSAQRRRRRAGVRRDKNGKAVDA